MNKHVVIEKVSKILGKSVNEIAYSIPLTEQIEALVKVAERNNSITHLRNEAYQTAKSKGWHDEKRETGTLLMLIVGEVAEAMEADRRHEGKDRVTEELADVIIRIFDFCGEKGLDLETAILNKMEFNKTRDYKHGGKAY